ncbi:Lsr2 protein [Modestobacter sp. DSM 44400]|uniref:histone-like nucleoid-structuring protein Lsr2 n=1 Tax=Modestobacter sp. DSM 44400 TaxID=1550230 RepID=UPI000897F6C3|nr:Lsr2 family protein [Modestobacter sp. DSM 44400]SDX46330.1 Lsr2 protein [Modestobacter sp. DSM 44400]
MAKTTTVVLVDDLNGDPADTTIRFGLDSREYELDLTDKNAQELRGLFDRYISAARKVSGARRRSTAGPAKPAFTAVDPAAARAWAKGKGIDVSSRGRVKADVLAAYRAAGN